MSVVYGQHCPERAALGGCREAMEKNLEENERVLMDTWSVPNLEWQSDAGTVRIIFLSLELFKPTIKYNIAGL